MAEQSGEHDAKTKRHHEWCTGITGHFQDEVGLRIEHCGGEGLAPAVEKIAAMERGTVGRIIEAVLPQRMPARHDRNDGEIVGRRRRRHRPFQRRGIPRIGALPVCRDAD